MRRYLFDLIRVIWEWVTISKIPLDIVERRKRFLQDAFSDERKKSLPYKIVMRVYNKRLRK